MTFLFQRSRLVRRSAAATIASVVAVLSLPAILFAHARLTKSAPFANENIIKSPDAIRLWFSEAPELAFTKIAVFAADSSEISLGAVQRIPDDRLGVTATIGSALAPGTYTVVWQVAAADGHPSRGRFKFTLLPGPTPAPATTIPANDLAAKRAQMMRDHARGNAHAMGDTTATAIGEESDALVLARFLSFVSLLVLVGVMSFRWLTVPSAIRIAQRHARAESLKRLRERMTPKMARLGLVAVLFLVVAAIARLYLQSYAIHGAGDATDPAMMRSMLMETTWGKAWLVQAAAAIVGGASLLLVTATTKHGRAGPWWVLATVATVILAFTPAFSGHAAASPRLSGLAVVADGLHVLGAGGWLGTLLVVLAVGLPMVLTANAADRGGIAADLINAFSPAALLFASLVVVTGLCAAWLHVGSVASLWRTTYGRTLLIKLGVLLPAVGTGAYNWLRVRPALGDVAAANRLRRPATLEVIIGGGVVLVTAVLVALQTPIE